jgi:hypothetical protein
MPSDGSSSRRWLFVAALIGAIALTVGLSVQAQREPAPVVQPYDPLPKW